MKQTQKLAAMALFLAALISLIGTAGAATYYLEKENPSCSDSAAGTESQPWCTVAKAQSAVAKGDVVFIKNGDYGKIDFNKSLGAASWNEKITYKAAPGATPVFRYLGINKTSFIEIDGISIIVPDEGTVRNYGSMIKDSSHIRLLNLNIKGIWRDPQEDGLSYAGVQLRTTGTNTIEDILIEGCEIQDFLQGIVLSYNIRDNIVVRNNTIHHLSSSGIAIDAYDQKNGTILIENNEIYEQIPVSASHGTGISIRSSNITVRNNIIHLFGNTRGIRTYQEMFDGGVEFTGTLRNPDVNFLAEEEVYQEGGSGTGKVYSFSGTATKNLRVLRSEENNLFVSGKNIVGKTSGAVLENVAMGTVRPYGGYHDMLIENNLVYDTRNYYATEFVDIGKNFVFRNNTIVGHYCNTHPGLNCGTISYYSTAITFGRVPATDYSTFVMQNNIFVGQANVKTEFLAGKISKNIAYSGNLDKTKNIVYYSGSGSRPLDFEGTGFFSTSIDYNYLHEKNLNQAFKLSPTSPAIGYADPTGAPATDILGIARDASPDAGAFEFQGKALPCTQAQLTSYLSQWKAGTLQMEALMQKIAAWKAGQTC